MVNLVWVEIGGDFHRIEKCLMSGWKQKFQNNPQGRIERFLCEHKDDLDDFGGMFSSNMKTYTLAPFLVKHLEEIKRLAEPREDDSDRYV